MTSFKKAQAEGIPWPQGPDDMCPSKQENTYLYAGGRTRKLKILLGGISFAWVLGVFALDKHLTRNRALVQQNYLLERVIIHSSRYMLPVLSTLWIGIPVSQFIYWTVLDISVGAKGIPRDPRPNWKPGEGLLDKIQ